MWLVVIDHIKPARPGRSTPRAGGGIAPVMTETTKSLAYRRPGVLTRLKAILGIGIITALIGLLLAIVVGLAIGATIFLLRDGL
jgi:hypothetical protein